MPAILDKAVKRIKARGVAASSAYQSQSHRCRSGWRLEGRHNQSDSQKARGAVR
jgi:hypothetical protein